MFVDSHKQPLYLYTGDLLIQIKNIMKLQILSAWGEYQPGLVDVDDPLASHLINTGVAKLHGAKDVKPQTVELKKTKPVKAEIIKPVKKVKAVKAARTIKPAKAAKKRR